VSVRGIKSTVHAAQSPGCQESHGECRTTLIGAGKLQELFEPGCALTVQAAYRPEELDRARETEPQ
jgi:hypothetical protein